MDHTPRSILVTGGEGFIDPHLGNALVEKYPQYHIVALDKVDTCSSMRNLDASLNKPNFHFVRGDIASSDLVRYVLQTHRIDTIVHAAAQSHVDNSFGNSFMFTEANVLGTHILMETAQACGIERFVHVSTDEVYGSCDDIRRTEESMLDPCNPYAGSKAAAENIVRGYYNSFGFPVIITRGNNVYGPQQYPEKLIPKFVLRLQQGKKCCIHGDGQSRRHFVHVHDVVRAFDLILHKGKVGQIYNIGSPDEFSNLEIAQKIVRLVCPGEPCEAHIEYVEDRAFNDVRYFLSYDKLKQLGWSPRVTFDEGLAETLQWYADTDPNQYWKGVDVAIRPHPE